MISVLVRTPGEFVTHPSISIVSVLSAAEAKMRDGSVLRAIERAQQNLNEQIHFGMSTKYQLKQRLREASGVDIDLSAKICCIRVLLPNIKQLIALF